MERKNEQPTDSHKKRAAAMLLRGDESDLETSDDEPENDNPNRSFNKDHHHAAATATNDHSSILQPPPRRQTTMGMLRRTVPLGPRWSINVWEWEKPAPIIETYWQVEQQGLDLTNNKNRNSNDSDDSTATLGKKASPSLLDPFGLVLWPGAVVAAQEMMEERHLIQGKRVLVLGSGVGTESIAAAMLGAQQVIATDLHPTTIKLLQYGAQQAGVTDKIQTQLLDITATATTAQQQEHYEPLPDCEVLVAADVLYNPKLCWHVMERIVEARRRNPNCLVLLSDSQRFISDFDVVLSNKLMQLQDEQQQQQQQHQHAMEGEETDTTMTSPKPQKTVVQWQSRFLPKFTGSGIFVEQDQTYEVKARVLWIGKD